jgi:hypothetical protein
MHIAVGIKLFKECLSWYLTQALCHSRVLWQQLDHHEFPDDPFPDLSLIILNPLYQLRRDDIGHVVKEVMSVAQLSQFLLPLVELLIIVLQSHLQFVLDVLVSEQMHEILQITRVEDILLVEREVVEHVSDFGNESQHC